MEAGFRAALKESMDRSAQARIEDWTKRLTKNGGLASGAFDFPKGRRRCVGGGACVARGGEVLYGAAAL
eukprot:15226704-Alexandrium_andersonii.AAC.1